MGRGLTLKSLEILIKHVRLSGLIFKASELLFKGVTLIGLCYKALELFFKYATLFANHNTTVRFWEKAFSQKNSYTLYEFFRATLYIYLYIFRAFQINRVFVQI